MWCSGLGIYGFMFLRLREFVSVVFELWVRGGKNLKLGVGKRENMGYEQEKKEKRKKKWSGEESKSGLASFMELYLTSLRLGDSRPVILSLLFLALFSFVIRLLLGFLLFHFSCFLFL